MPPTDSGAYQGGWLLLTMPPAAQTTPSGRFGVRCKCVGHLFFRQRKGAPRICRARQIGPMA